MNHTSSGRRALRRTGSSLAIAGFASLPSCLIPALVRADTPSAIKVTAERTVIRADGVSTTVLSAQVYTNGNFAADGTRVRFQTSAGRFDATVVATQNGIARATLTSADQAGVATVQVFLDSPGQSVPVVLYITFSNEAVAEGAVNPWIHVDGDYTAYVTDYENMKLIQANGSRGTARLAYRGLTISGDAFQIDLILNLVTVRGHVVISKEGVKREYRDANFDLTRGTGIGQRIDDGRLETYKIEGPKLSESKRPIIGEAPLDPKLFAFQDLADGYFTVVATTIALDPNIALQFHNATVYGQGYRLRIKNYVLAWDQKTVYPLPLIGYGPSGPTFDIPYDYDLQTTTRGTLQVREGAQIGSSVYSVRPGLSLDAVQTYSGPQSIDGVVEVDGIGRGDWSAQIHHSQRLDPTTTASIFLQAPSISNIFLTTQITRSYKNFQVNLLGSGTRTGAFIDPTTLTHGKVSGDARGQITAQTFGKPVFGISKLQYVLEAGVSRQQFFGGSTLVTQTTTGSHTNSSRDTTVVSAAAAQGIVDTQQLSSRFYTPALPIAPMLTLTQSVTVGQNWVEGEAARSNGVAPSGISLLGTTTFTRTLGPLGNGNVAYNYAQTPQILTSGIATAANAENAHHRVSLGVNLGHGQAWNLNFTGSRGLDIDQSSFFTVLGFSLGGPTRGSLTINNTHADGTEYTDVEYRLTRTILAHGYSLYYSTTYKRIQFDTSAIAF